MWEDRWFKDFKSCINYFSILVVIGFVITGIDRFAMWFFKIVHSANQSRLGDVFGTILCSVCIIAVVSLIVAFIKNWPLKDD